jgi:hypothetical protein
MVDHQAQRRQLAGVRVFEHLGVAVGGATTPSIRSR